MVHLILGNPQVAAEKFILKIGVLAISGRSIPAHSFSKNIEAAAWKVFEQ